MHVVAIHEKRGFKRPTQNALFFAPFSVSFLRALVLVFLLCPQEGEYVGGDWVPLTIAHCASGANASLGLRVRVREKCSGMHRADGR